MSSTRVAIVIITFSNSNSAVFLDNLFIIKNKLLIINQVQLVISITKF